MPGSLGRPARSGLWSDVLLTALGPIIWGSTYILTTELLPPDRPFLIAVIRTVPAGLLLILFTRALPQRRAWVKLVVLSAFNIGIFQALLFVAAYRLPGGLAAVVGAIQPLLIIALAWLVDRQRPLRLAVWACILGVVGMAVLLLSPTTVWEPVGIGAALIGAASMAVGTFLTQRWRLRMPVFALTGWQLLLGGLMLVPAVWLFDTPLPVLTLVHVISFTYLCLAGAVLAYGLWFRGVARLSPVAVTSLALLSPVTAVILGWAILGQSMTGVSLLGLVMVLVSIFLVQRTMGRRPAAVKTPIEPDRASCASGALPLPPSAASPAAGLAPLPADASPPPPNKLS